MKGIVHETLLLVMPIRRERLKEIFSFRHFNIRHADLDIEVISEFFFGGCFIKA